MSENRSIAFLTSSAAIHELSTNSFLKNVKIHEGETIFLDKSISNKSTDSVENLNGINWYDFLVLHDNVMSLMDEFTYEKLCKMFVVCCTLPHPTDKMKKPRRKFAAFNSYTNFLEYIRLIPSQQWYFFEIIMAEHKQKLYFDIDIEKEKLPAGENIEVFSNNLLNSLISGIVNCLPKYEIEINVAKDLLIFSSNANHKHSYHVILNNYYVMNNHCNTILCGEIKEYMPEQYRSYIDEAVYSAKQQLRLYKSQKPGTGRIKELMKSYTYGINVINQDDSNFEFVFSSSCITYVEKCTVIPVYHTIDKSLLVINEGKNNEKLLDEDVKKIVKLVNPIVFKIYKMTRIIGRMILLQRIQKAHCSLCNRVHDNENAFLTVSENWDIYFYCRREQSKSLYMGHLFDNSESEQIAKKVVEGLKTKLESQVLNVPLNTIPTIAENKSSFNSLMFSSNFGTSFWNSSYFKTPTSMPTIIQKVPIHQKLREISIQPK